MNCPACNTVMREREKESVIVDVCPNCKGMWLDHGELEKLVEIESERDGRYRRYYDDDDDGRRPRDRDDDRRRDDDDYRRRDDDYRRGKEYAQPQKKKKGFFSTLMETVGGEGGED